MRAGSCRPAALPPHALGAALCCVAVAFGQSRAAARPKPADRSCPAARRGALRWAQRAVVGSARCSRVGWHAMVGLARCGGLGALQWSQHAAVGLTPPPHPVGAEWSRVEPSGAEWRGECVAIRFSAPLLGGIVCLENLRTGCAEHWREGLHAGRQTGRQAGHTERRRAEMERKRADGKDEHGRRRKGRVLITFGAHFIVTLLGPKRRSSVWAPNRCSLIKAVKAVAHASG